jgi:hypothetical protein
MPSLPRAAVPLPTSAKPLAALLPILLLCGLGLPLPAALAEEDPLQFIAFSTDFDSKCVQRNGVMIYIANKHPNRSMRLVLERWYMDNRTADRGKSLLKPGEEPEPLGCSNVEGGKQEWKVLKSEWAD